MDSTQPSVGREPEVIIIPIACRFVPTDQWLITHIDVSWKISQVKLFLLAKFFPSSFISVSSLPRVQASSKRRAVSPIRFATKTQASAAAAAAAQASDGENGYDEDEEDFGDELFAQFKWTVSPRKSTSTVPLIAKVTQDLEKPSEESADQTQYTLLAFSSGQILEEHYSLDWFNINPHELLELHSANYMVNLPKSVPEQYVQPYFEARVWALRAISKVMDGELESGSRRGDSLENSPYASDDWPADPSAARRDKLAKKRRTKLEWRVRWVIIHKGIFKLCKSRNDSKPTHVSPLSSLIAVRGADHPSVGFAAFPPLSSSSSIDQPPSKDRPSKDSKSTVIHAKFRLNRDKSSRLLQSGPSVVEVTAGSSTAGGWWRRGSKDANGGHERRRGSGQDSETAMDGRDDPAGMGGDDRTTDNSVSIILDMQDESALQNILRVLHRHASPTVQSTYFPTSSPTGGLRKHSRTAHHPSKLRESPSRPPSPISFASRPPSTIPPPSRPTSPLSIPSTLDDSSTSTQSRSPLPVASPIASPVDVTSSFSYPKWRLNVFDRARRAGCGDMGKAISLHIFGAAQGSRTEDDSDVETLNSGRGDMRWRGKGAGLEDQDELETPTTNVDVDDPGSDTNLLPAALHDNDSESSGSVDEDDVESETEWDGWVQEVQWRRDAAFAKLKEEREKNAIQWDSSWTWNYESQPHEGEPRQAQADQSVSPRADQTTFAASENLSSNPHADKDRVGGGRSVTSYASADSLFKRTIKRNNSKREPATVVGVTAVVRAEHQPHGGDPAQDYGKLRPRSPLSAEFDDFGEDEAGHEPKYTYASSSKLPYVHAQSSSLRSQHSEADLAAPFHSYTDSTQRMPMSMGMTTVTSTVSVGGRDGAHSKKKKKDTQNARGSRKAILTSFSSAAGNGSSGPGRDHIRSARAEPARATSTSKGKSRGHSEHAEDTESHSPSSSRRGPTKPTLSMNFIQPTAPQGNTGRSSQLSSAVSVSSANWESPRFAKPDESD